MRPRRLTARWRLLAAVVALTVTAVTPAAVSLGARTAVLDPLISQARLGGVFEMAGTVTNAVGVPGEYPGQAIQRSWSFLALCDAGPCAAVELTRQRQFGTDRVLLQRSGPGLYSGVGTFVAPARCHGIAYRKGMLVPFSISVQITGYSAQGLLVQATQLHATYTNRKRINLTRCVAAPSYDAAIYDGAVVAVGTTRKVPRT